MIGREKKNLEFETLAVKNEDGLDMFGRGLGSRMFLMTEERMTLLCSHQILVTTRTWCLNHICNFSQGHFNAGISKPKAKQKRDQ
jgi:hypothetical protein